MTVQVVAKWELVAGLPMREWDGRIIQPVERAVAALPMEIVGVGAY